MNNRNKSFYNLVIPLPSYNR